MFNAQQEMDLGEVMAEQIQRQYNVIDDPAVTAYLQRVGDRLVHHVTSETMKYQFVLYDQPVANALVPPADEFMSRANLWGLCEVKTNSRDCLATKLGTWLPIRALWKLQNFSKS